MLTGTTTSITVEEFLKKTFGKLDVKNNILVMDNHAAHNSYIVRDRIQKLGMVQHFLPVASCYLNPIEHVWGIFKNKWATYLIENKEAINPENSEVHIKKVLDSINFGNVSHSVFEPMYQVLDGN